MVCRPQTTAVWLGTTAVLTGNSPDRIRTQAIPTEWSEAAHRSLRELSGDETYKLISG